mgnify:CR=1 FL=1
MSIQNILDDLKNGSFKITQHGYLRMSERGVIFQDIESVGTTCTNWKQQSDGKFKVVGKDTVGDELTVICAYNGETLVITLF